MLVWLHTLPGERKKGVLGGVVIYSGFTHSGPRVTYIQSNWDVIRATGLEGNLNLQRLRSLMRFTGPTMSHLHGGRCLSSWHSEAEAGDCSEFEVSLGSQKVGKERRKRDRSRKQGWLG